MDSLGFTGSRDGLTPEQCNILFEEMINFKALHHGDAVGADAIADGMGHTLGLRVCVHPPNNPSKRAFCEGYDEIEPEYPYLVRDRRIVRHAEFLIACPNNETGEKRRSGTWATVRYARECKIPILIIRPSGRVERESYR